MSFHPTLIRSSQGKTFAEDMFGLGIVERIILAYPGWIVWIGS